MENNQQNKPKGIRKRGDNKVGSRNKRYKKQKLPWEESQRQN